MIENPYESPAEVADGASEPKPRRRLTWAKMTFWSGTASCLLYVGLLLIPERFSNPPEPRPNDLDLIKFAVIGFLMLGLASTLMCGLRWLMREDSED